MYLQQMKTAAILLLGLAAASAGVGFLSAAQARAKPQVVQPGPLTTKTPATPRNPAQIAQGSGKPSGASHVSDVDPELAKRPVEPSWPRHPSSGTAWFFPTFPTGTTATLITSGSATTTAGIERCSTGSRRAPCTTADRDHRFLLAVYARKAEGSEPPGRFWPSRSKAHGRNSVMENHARLRPRAGRELQVRGW